MSGELMDKVVDVDTLNKAFNIDYKLLDEKINGISKPLFNNIRQYFFFRRYSHEKIDHGILGGLYLYDRLLKNRIIQERNKESQLSWNKELDAQYAHAAAVIATHNIWFPNDETACDYIKFGMKELIDEKPISLTKSPLLFLLGVVDTIDPVKAYTEKYNVEDIIESLQLDFFEDKFIIENKIDSILDFNEIIKKSENLREWLSVEIIKNPNRIEIKFI